MQIEDYRCYYLDLSLGILAGNRAHFQITMEQDDPKIAIYKNYQRGLMVLALVSLIESKFLNKQDMKSLRKFEVLPNLNTAINQNYLSCFIYLRDCYAHNPCSKLLPSGVNTDGFKKALSSGSFTFAKIEGDNFYISDTHQLHLLVLRLYGEPV